MNKKKSFHTLSNRQPWMPLTLAFVLAIIYIFGQLNVPQQVLASAAPGGNIANPIVRAVDLAKPAVVRIITTIGGRLTVHFPVTNSPAVTFPQDGSQYNLDFSGSGAFISAHGDVLTADHVIKPSSDPSLDLYLQEMAAQDVADYVNANFTTTSGGPYTKDDALKSLNSGYFRSESKYASPSSEIYLSTDYTGPDNGMDIKSMVPSTHAPMDSVEKESSFDNKDVAIIHTSIDNTPFIPLGDSSNISQQDELTIIGFPGNGDVSDKKDPGTFFTSSINKVYVSAIKKTDAGAPVIQVGGNIEHGDSGGPALDSNGNIVGIVSFGLESSQPEGTTFLQTSASAKELLQSLSLNTRPGTLQKAWRQAFSDYASNTPGHWHKANQDFERISKQFPQFHGIDPYLDYTMSQARREVIPTASSTNGLTILGGGALAAIVVVLLLLLLLILLIRRGRATPARRTASTIPNTAPPMAAYGQYYNPGSQPAANTGPDRTPAAFAAQGTEPDWSPTPAAQPAPSVQQTPPIQEFQPAYQPLQPTPAAEGQPAAPRAEQSWTPAQQPAQPVRPVQPTPPIQEYRPAYPPSQRVQGDAFGQRPAPNWPPAQSWPSAQPTRPVQPPPSQEYRPTYPAAQGHDPYRPATQLGQVTPISRIIPPATPSGEPEKAEPANPNTEQEQAKLSDTQSLKALRPDQESARQNPYTQDEPTMRKQPSQQTTDDAPTLIGDRPTYVRPTPYGPGNPTRTSSDNNRPDANEQTLN